jgi:hypothetical protein
LISFNLRNHRAEALVISKNELSITLGLLATTEPLDTLPPFAIDLDLRYVARKGCVSFGTEWVLETFSGAESLPGKVDEAHSSGMITLTRAGPTIYLPVRDGYASGYTFNLQSNEVVSEDDDGVRYLQWEIWASEDDRRDPRSKPIVLSPARQKVLEDLN